MISCQIAKLFSLFVRVWVYCFGIFVALISLCNNFIDAYFGMVDA